MFLLTGATKTPKSRRLSSGPRRRNQQRSRELRPPRRAQPGGEPETDPGVGRRAPTRGQGQRRGPYVRQIPETRGKTDGQTEFPFLFLSNLVLVAFKADPRDPGSSRGGQER